MTIKIKFFLWNKIELLKLDYKYISSSKKEQEYELLNMKLKDLFSKDISCKYKKQSDYNKKVIENKLKDANDTILFVFNMTLRDWLDIFTFKKTVKDIINKYNNINCQNIDEKKIEQSLVGVSKLLNNINMKNMNNGEEYMAFFIFYLYNYERWFYLKKSRKRFLN